MHKITARVRAPSASRTLSVYGMETSACPWAISTRPSRRAIAGNGESRSRAARATVLARKGIAVRSASIDWTKGAVTRPAAGRASTSEKAAAEPKRTTRATTTRPRAAAAIARDLRVPAKLRAEPGDRAAGQGVDALVQRVAGVAGHLAPDDVVALRLGEQPFPEVAIGDRLLLGVLPAVLLPALPPALTEAVHDVGAVRVQEHALT